MKKILLVILMSCIGNSFAINEVQFIKLLQKNHPFLKLKIVLMMVCRLIIILQIHILIGTFLAK